MLTALRESETLHKAGDIYFVLLSGFLLSSYQVIFIF